jgi:shikimate dehydrogenase
MSLPYAEVIGDPIAHSKSPLIHKFWLNKLGIEADYSACHVKPDALADYLAQRRQDINWRGCNVTLPHKMNVIAQLDAISSLAARVGAVNTVLHTSQGGLEGENTDVPGFAEPLAGCKFNRIAIIGAGGAARAVLAGLAGRQIECVTILNRDIAKAEKLITEFGMLGTAQPLDGQAPEADLLVNASSLGMRGQPPLPGVQALVAGCAIVYDLVYAPLETDLLAAARSQGRATIDGLTMLIGQAAEAFCLFFGQPAPREHDGELRALLIQ